MSYSGNEKTLRLRSSDGEEFEVSENAAALSQKIIKLAAEDGGSSVNIIPIPEVDGKTLAKVLAYCEGQATIAEKTAEFDRRFVEEVETAALFGLLNAAHYLEINDLLNMLIGRAADILKDSTAEQIRKALDIKNDFTPEEEQQMKRETPWAFD